MKCFHENCPEDHCLYPEIFDMYPKLVNKEVLPPVRIYDEWGIWPPEGMTIEEVIKKYHDPSTIENIIEKYGDKS